MKIAPAAPEDAEIIAALNAAVQKIHAEAWPKIFKPVSDNNSTVSLFVDLLADSDNRFYLASLDEKPVGYIWARIERREETSLKYARKLVYIHQISVNPDVQERGIGQALLKKIIHLAEEQKITEIALDIWSFNQKARDFFTRQGFTDYNVRLRRRINSV